MFGFGRFGSEIVFEFERAGFDYKTVRDAGLEEVRFGAGHGGFHAGDESAVFEAARGHGLIDGLEVPDRVRVFVGFDFAQGKNLDGSELEFTIEVEEKGNHGLVILVSEPGEAQGRARAMRDLERSGGKPVSVDIKEETGQHENEDDEKNILLCHIQTRMAGTEYSNAGWNGRSMIC